MLALCFSCGTKKQSALKLCGQCHAVPKTQEEKVLSLCLSLECVSHQSLNTCRRYFHRKNKPPRFKPPVIKRAKDSLQEMMASSGVERSIEFSSSVFNFEDLIQDDENEVIRQTVTVHVIGKGPKQESADANANLGKANKTYHRVEWEVGVDISEAEYETAKDPSGELHIWYRWLNNSWTKQTVSPAKFDQLKAIESGRLV